MLNLPKKTEHQALNRINVFVVFFLNQVCERIANSSNCLNFIVLCAKIHRTGTDYIPKYHDTRSWFTHQRLHGIQSQNKCNGTNCTNSTIIKVPCRKWQSWIFPKFIKKNMVVLWWGDINHGYQIFWQVHVSSTGWKIKSGGYRPFFFSSNIFANILCRLLWTKKTTEYLWSANPVIVAPKKGPVARRLNTLSYSFIWFNS